MGDPRTLVALVALLTCDACLRDNPRYDEASPTAESGGIGSSTTTGDGTTADETSAAPTTGTGTSEPTTGQSTAATGTEGTGTTAGMPCPTNQRSCGGACVDPRTDGSHCGDCFEACESRQRCEAGKCVVDCTLPGTAMCNGICVDTDTDPEHCGSCSGDCEPDLEICDLGRCVCRAGLVECHQRCVDLARDPEHCGGCEITCEYCGDRLCLSADECATFDVCGGVCTDFQSDPLHCGDCDTRCAVDELCVAGECRGYRPVECLQCSCAACDQDICCVSDFVKAAVCLEAEACPD